MAYVVSVTSQGQISIPAKIRKDFGLDKVKKVLVTVGEGKVILEPVKDLLELRGSLKTQIKATPRQIREAFEKYLTKQAIKGSK